LIKLSVSQKGENCQENVREGQLTFRIFCFTGYLDKKLSWRIPIRRNRTYCSL